MDVEGMNIETLGTKEDVSSIEQNERDTCSSQIHSERHSHTLY